MIVLFEGNDGCGKTTIINEVKELLLADNTSVKTLKNPSLDFKEIRRRVNSLNDLDLSFRFYLMCSLYSFTEAQINALDYDVVLLDRHIYSTIVSHTVMGYNVPKEYLLNKLFPKIDLEFLITVDLNVRRERILNRNEQLFEHDLIGLEEEMSNRIDTIYKGFGMIEIDNSSEITLSTSRIYQIIKSKLIK